MLSAGQPIDRYTVDAVLGQGGMAVVYRVVHNQLGSYHALKVLTLQSPGLTERLLQEGRVQASLRHPNVVAVTDVIDVGGHPGLVMEYVDGPSLDEWLRDHRPDVRDAERLFRMIVSGVAAAHDKGLVHRDLKPGNVMLAPTSGEYVPKVTDFGLAKALADEGEGMSRTRSGVTMGTPAYMAPEQIRDAKNVDHRADVFSLGCILYELVTGRPPFTGPDMLSIFNAVASGSYPPPVSLNPDLPARVQNTIQACLTVDRDRRAPTCKAVLDLLDARTSVPPATSPTVTPPDTGVTLHPAATWAGSVADVSVHPRSEPAPSAPAVSAAPRPRTDPPLDASLATASVPPPPPRRRRWLVPVLVATPIVVAGLGVVGFVGGGAWLRHRWERHAVQMLARATDGEVTLGKVTTRLRDVVVTDVTVTGTDGAPFAHIDRLVLVGRWNMGLRPRFVPETAAIEGLELELRDRPRGWALPEKTLALLRAPDGPTAGMALRDVTTDASKVALVVHGDRLETTWGSASLSGVGVSGDDWSAASFSVTDLRVGGTDPLLTAGSLAVGTDGALTASDLDVWLKLRADGLIDVPAALAERVPDYLGGTRRGDPDTSWTDLAHTLLPTVPTSASVGSGSLHLLDRAHAVRAVEWTVAVDRLAAGPARDGWTPVEMSGGIDGARVSVEGEVRDDGMMRGHVTTRLLPLDRLAPYMDASLRHYQVKPVSGTVALALGFTAKEDSVAADLDARAEDVRFAHVEGRAGSPPPPRGTDKLYASRPLVAASATTAGSLGDWEWRGTSDLLDPFVDALFAPAGRAMHDEAPLPPPPPELRPEPPPDRASVGPPGPKPDVAVKPDLPGPNGETPPEPRPRDKFGKDVREALEDMKDRLPKGR